MPVGDIEFSFEEFARKGRRLKRCEVEDIDVIRLKMEHYIRQAG